MTTKNPLFDGEGKTGMDGIQKDSKVIRVRVADLLVYRRLSELSALVGCRMKVGELIEFLGVRE